VALPSSLQRVLDWLHAGYPRGVPRQDYYALLAFLARHLQADEVSEVVSQLESGDSLSRTTTTEDVRAAIETVTSSPAMEIDVQRVERHLRDAGWEFEVAGDV
jgi:Protein of unknown function (DUF3349)